MSDAEIVSPTPPARRGVLSLLLGTVIRPRSTFDYLRAEGGWVWIVPLALALALTLVSRAIAVPIERAQMEAALKTLQGQTGFAPPAGQSFGIVVGGPGGPDAAPFTSVGASPLLEYGLPALNLLGEWGLRIALLLGLAWVLGGRPGLGALTRLSSFVLVPAVAQAVVTIGFMLVTGRIPSSGLSTFTSNVPGVSAPVLEGASPGSGDTFTVGPGGAVSTSGGPSFFELFWLNLLGAANVYWVWTLALIVVGVTVMTRLGWAKSLLAASIYAAVSVALSVLPTLFMPLLMSLFMGGPMMAP